MSSADEKIQTVLDKLSEYAEKVGDGRDLHETEDALEIEVKNGRMWVHPQEDGTTVKIHLFDDTGEGDFMPARPRIQNHLGRELEAPMTGKYEPYTEFMGSDRLTIRVNFQYIRERQ